MAIKISSKKPDNIPTLTETVTEKTGSLPQSKQTGQDSPDSNPLKNNGANSPLPPKFERLLEKIIYKKLHQQLADTSQSLATEIMAELEKYLQAADNIQNKPDKNQN